MLATILISILLVVIVTAIVIHLIKNKKAGKSTCGCNCHGCTNSKNCHPHS